jgi:membrane associated rhomboid family serine protease
LKSLRNRFERFCYRNRNKGIPNLMLYISIANAVVYVMSLIDGSNTLYSVLCFDRDLILQGQIWRLLTCICTSVFSYGNLVFVAISLLCYYSLGKAVENTWGTFRFNLFYLTGILLMDVFALVFGGMTFTFAGVTYHMDPGFYADMGSHLNLSLFIAYATLYPNAQFLFLFIIPVKAWIFALIYLGITLYQVIHYTFIVTAFPHGLFPLVALLNYFLFFGKDVVNIFPMSWRANFSRLFKKKKKYAPGPAKTIPFPTAGSYQATVSQPKAPYNHRCTVCGRTDISDPELEFRYCSRCNGYFCYCEEHISNHVHMQ